MAFKHCGCAHLLVLLTPVGVHHLMNEDSLILDPAPSLDTKLACKLLRIVKAVKKVLL